MDPGAQGSTYRNLDLGGLSIIGHATVRAVGAVVEEELELEGVLLAVGDLEAGDGVGELVGEVEVRLLVLALADDGEGAPKCA